MSALSLCPASPPTFWLLTTNPAFMETYFEEGVVGRARRLGLIRVFPLDLRRFAEDRHRKVDDQPYGGGPGMVLMVGPIYRAVEFVRSRVPRREELTVVLTDAGGESFDQGLAAQFSRPRHHTLIISGRYEGVDQRVADHLADRLVRVGEAVLSSGDLPALVMVDAAARLVAGVLGNPLSLAEETGGELVDYPVYTRPPEFRGWRVPEILLSGHHREIRRWRTEWRRHRPDPGEGRDTS